MPSIYIFAVQIQTFERPIHGLKLQIRILPVRFCSQRLQFPANSARLQNIDTFLKKYSPDGSTFDVSSHDRYIYVHPAALAMAACAGVTCKNNSIPAQGAVADMASVPYLVRMKLFEHLGIHPPREIIEHEEAGRFIPLTQIHYHIQTGLYLSQTHFVGGFMKDAISKISV